MTNGQHTPGPWFIVSDEPDCVSTAGHRALMELQDDDYIDCNSEANARLIAAAPDLLEALEMLVRWDETGEPVSNLCFAQARSAILKAKRQN